MKNHKKFLLLLIGICICCLLFFIVQIYAKYITSAEGSTTLTIANWNILVNTEEILFPDLTGKMPSVRKMNVLHVLTAPGNQSSLTASALMNL